MQKFLPDDRKLFPLSNYIQQMIMNKMTVEKREALDQGFIIFTTIHVINLENQYSIIS